MSFNNEEIERFKNANKKLGIGDSPSNPRDNNLIIIYSSPKVGSTSLVSSLRLKRAFPPSGGRSNERLVR